jgi:hypothetical protein
MELQEKQQCSKKVTSSNLYFEMSKYNFQNLLKACIEGQLDKAKMLVQNGADPKKSKNLLKRGNKDIFIIIF